MLLFKSILVVHMVKTDWLKKKSVGLELGVGEPGARSVPFFSISSEYSPVTVSVRPATFAASHLLAFSQVSSSHLFPAIGQSFLGSSLMTC